MTHGGTFNGAAPSNSGEGSHIQDFGGATSHRSEMGGELEIQPTTGPSGPRKGARFWMIFVGMTILSFLCGLDTSIVHIALARIVHEIGGADNYIWIANSFVIASCVPQPLLGHIADVYGRRVPMIASVVLFTLGSGLGGGASSPGMLIAARAVQGLGAGGIYVLLDIIVCDMVALRERGMYLALMNSGAAIGTTLGPPVGGALAQRDWRWIFYMNLPFCGVCLVIFVLFLRVNTGTIGKTGGGDGAYGHNSDAGSPTWWTKMRQLDIVGSLIFIPSLVAVLIGLVMGGTPGWAWSSPRIIVPLVLGFLGWAAFHVQQFFTSHPSIPPSMFANRTSAAAFMLTFLSSIVMQTLGYFIPIYFQGVLATTPLQAGTNYLPTAMSVLFIAVAGGVLLTTFGKYRRLHYAGAALMSLGFGLCTMLDRDTPTVAWAFFQLITAGGMGLLVSTTLPAIMAGLPESAVAASTAAYCFIRTFGFVWGVTIPGVIFNAAVDKELHLVSDPAIRERMSNGAAYAFAGIGHDLQDQLSSRLWDEVTEVFVRGLRAVWYFAMAISIVSFLVVILERSLKLRTELETEYGLQEGDQKATGTKAQDHAEMRDLRPEP